MRCVCDWIEGKQIKVTSAGCPVHSASLKLSESLLVKCDDEIPGMYPQAMGQPEKAQDDRHTFASGASSSGRKPPYHTVPAYFFDRVANVRGFGDAKYGVDNWKKGARDTDFILDRINHGIQHFLKLAEYVKAGRINASDTEPGHDDAAAVAVNALFVMEWQRQRANTHVRTTERAVDQPYKRHPLDESQ